MSAYAAASLRSTWFTGAEHTNHTTEYSKLKKGKY